MIRLAATFAGLLLSSCVSSPVPDRGASEWQTNSGRQDAKLIGTKLDLNLCNTKVSNAPNSIAGRVLRESALACLNSKPLLVAPAPGACVTSGYGLRSRKRHQGIDFQALPAGPVIAAGAGTVVQKQYRAKDLGNWIVIDHGSDVYTAYGHLSKIFPSVSVGKKVSLGQQLGLMGSTGNAARGVHLHYEVRVGRLSAATGFFNLQSIDPFELPADCG